MRTYVGLTIQLHTLNIETRSRWQVEFVAQPPQCIHAISKWDDEGTRYGLQSDGLQTPALTGIWTATSLPIHFLKQNGRKQSREQAHIDLPNCNSSWSAHLCTEHDGSVCLLFRKEQPHWGSSCFSQSLHANERGKGRNNDEKVDELKIFGLLGSYAG
jgi:hypothetical protein